MAEGEESEEKKKRKRIALDCHITTSNREEKYLLVRFRDAVIQYNILFGFFLFFLPSFIHFSRHLARNTSKQ